YLITYLNSWQADSVYSALLQGRSEPSWIGMFDPTQTGSYVWLTADPPEWLRWRKGEPLGHVGGCTLQNPPMMPPMSQSYSYSWSVVDCSSQYGFICEESPPVIRRATNHAYRALYARIGWASAKASCEASHGHLVTINDVDEQAFVAKLAVSEFWLGGTDRVTPGDFNWVTSEPFSLWFFTPGEPNHADSAKCLVMGIDEGWHDRACGDQNPYVCEYD
ncbi:MAG TPA: C-type lectin domain-containing protein, partial [Polyangiaceae bacterium]|nr:C-type lectin domain-containing protein [Polyangiaceae bacterium]